MTKILDILNQLKKYAVFNGKIFENKFKSREYSNLFLNRLKKRGIVLHIERNKYTIYDDAFLISSRVIWPSYISGWSALKYHNLTEQIPHDIWVVSTKYKNDIVFNNVKIRFIKMKNTSFFGFEKVKYNNFEIFIADAEKAIIDSLLLKLVSFSEIAEIVHNNFKGLDSHKLIRYLKRLGNKSLIKRIGFILEKNGRDYHKLLREYIDQIYIPLDCTKERRGRRNEKWKVIVND